MTGAVWTWIAVVAQAQDDGPGGPVEGPGLSLPSGDYVDVETQRDLGLVTIYGAYGQCTGTLVNQYWVLTADRCLIADDWWEAIPSPATRIEASWSAERPMPTKIVRVGTFALAFLGEGDFGPADSQPYFVGEPDETVHVRKYGRGLTNYAQPGPPVVAATRDGTIRTGLFVPYPADVYWWESYGTSMNEAGQTVGAGDGGGPDIVEYDGIPLGISGVHYWCDTHYLPGDETVDRITGVGDCGSSLIEPFREDIIAAVQEVPAGQLHAALSTGDAFLGATEWASGFCTRDETCAMGDVDGDGFADAIRFVKSDQSPRDGDVWVAFSDGTERFLAPQLKFDSFCTHDEVCAVADMNGDGRDDLVTFMKSNGTATDKDVWVALSVGTSFGGSQRWSDYFCPLAETCALGDMNGDGKADLVSFVGSNGGVGDNDVWVALSGSQGAATARKWHDWFCTSGEVCRVADVNGDGRDDIVSFVRTDGSAYDSDIWVALSTGSGFGALRRWHDYFCTRDETCLLGDVTGDGRADAVSFVRTNNGVGDSDVWVGPSTGAVFGAGQKWQEFFCTLDQTCALADVDGDGFDDAIAFVRGD